MRIPTYLLFSVACLLCADNSPAQEPTEENPSFDCDVAQAHEIKRIRHSFPLRGIQEGFHQLHLALLISPSGEVLKAEAVGDTKDMRYWPQIEGEVRNWKFMPFEQDGKPVTAEVEEYIDLLPPERLPTKHVPPPVIRPSSQIVITLERSGCYGTCPSYVATITNGGISFNGRGFVVAVGNHSDRIDSGAVRDLAKRFVASDFYSMEPNYHASVTDNPTYVLSISIDGRKSKVVDYVGSWKGMPAIITELEDAVDQVANTQRWIEGREGLVESLRDDDFDFHSFEAQTILKEAAARGEAATVSELLQAGVSLQPLRRTKLADSEPEIGWLQSASAHREALKVLIAAGASKNDQRDKDLALAMSAQSGNVDGVRSLIAYGANPNADFSKVEVTENSGTGMTTSAQGAGSILIYAANSGRPEIIREILRYHPDLEARDREGKTALFAAGEYRYNIPESARVEGVRLLVQAGANVNARDRNGNTPLHETFLTEVEAELLELGADVNARNNDGETPIFTNVDDKSIPLFIQHGADLTIRNNEDQTVFDVAKRKGPARESALQKAVQAAKRQ